MKSPVALRSLRGAKRSRPVRAKSKARRSLFSQVWRTIQHFILPTDRNSRRAKLLHSDSLVAIAAAMVMVHVSLAMFLKYPVLPSVLGQESPITPVQVLNQVNTQREQYGLQPLQTNEALNIAAQAKAQDMIANGYWSHTSPSGKEPWDFILDSGYQYSVAGENLARNFTNAERMTVAWMASPTHKANILHGQYQETGLAVLEGNMNGRRTTLVVQLFGSPETLPAPSLPERAFSATRLLTQPAAPSQTILGVQTAFTPLHFYRLGILFILGVLVGVLVMDSLQARRNKWSRKGGRSMAHLTLLVAVMATVALAERGSLL